MPTAATVGIEVRGAKALKRAFRFLGETDAPFLREELDELGRGFERETAQRAPGSIAATVAFVGVRGSGANLRAPIKVSHAGAAAMEFGRKTYYEGYHDRQMKATGRKKRVSRGQQSRPYIGIIRGDKAIGAMQERAEQGLKRAVEREFERIVAEGDRD